MMYVRFPLSLRNVEDVLHERGIDISHEDVSFWWNRFGPNAQANRRAVTSRCLFGLRVNLGKHRFRTAQCFQ